MVRNITEAPAREGGCGCGDEVRCGCGSLLARVVEGAIELKCRRCKRVWRVRLEGVLATPRATATRARLESPSDVASARGLHPPSSESREP